MPQNPGVKRWRRPKGGRRVSPRARLPAPLNLAPLKAARTRRWPRTRLVDVWQDPELRGGLPPHGMDTGPRVGLDEATWQRRLLLCRLGLGTHTGRKRGGAPPPEAPDHDLFEGRRRDLHPEALRNAMAHGVNALFRRRATHLGGAGTTACAADATQLGAWDQQRLTAWHLREGGLRHGTARRVAHQ